MPNEYQNILTDLVKRIRPLLVNIATRVATDSFDFVPVRGGQNTTTATFLGVGEGINPVCGIDCTDGEVVRSFGSFRNPRSGYFFLYPIVRYTSAATTGNIRIRTFVYRFVSTSADKEFLDYSGTEQTITLPDDAGADDYSYEITTLGAAAYLDAIAGELIYIYTIRDGADALDTINADIHFMGWRYKWAASL